MNTTALCVATLVVATLSGCAMSPVTVRASHIAPAARNTTKPAGIAADGCAVHFASLKDGRADPSYLGNVAGRAVRSPGAGTEWIGGLIASGLQQKGIAATFEPAFAPDARVTIAEARLVSVWVASVTTSMNGAAVLAVRHNASDADEKIYRGSSTLLNWASGQGEIQGLLDSAIEQMLTKLAADIKTSCKPIARTSHQTELP